jgi:DNA-binding response OmpR family regulator
MSAEKSVLVIDDEPGVRTLLIRALRAAGFVTYEAPDGEAGIQVLERTAVDLVIVDIIMPRKEGVETILEMKKRWPALKVIAISGGGRIGPEAFLSLAEGLGADAIMKKPLNFKALIEQVHALLKPAPTRAA